MLIGTRIVHMEATRVPALNILLTWLADVAISVLLVMYTRISAIPNLPMQERLVFITCGAT